MKKYELGKFQLNHSDFLFSEINFYIIQLIATHIRLNVILGFRNHITDLTSQAIDC